MSLDPATISSALGAPLGHVEANWPLIVAALGNQGIGSDLVQIAAAATVMVETGTFQPIEERGGDAYFTRLYDHRLDLGNVLPGDGARFHGRGFVQITGRENYRTFGTALGLDLENHPELALEPGAAARILALFFAGRHVAQEAESRNWLRTRIRVNGINRATGLPNGWPQYQTYVNALLGGVG